MAAEDTMHKQFAFFRNPETAAHLRYSSIDRRLVDDAGQSFPVLNGVPFLMPLTAINHQEWLSRFSALFAKAKRELDLIQGAISSLDTGTDTDTQETRARLQTRFEACKSNIQLYWQILQDFTAHKGLEPAGGEELKFSNPIEAYSLLLSSRQNLLSYGDNLFRDWAWGEKEIAEAVSASAGQLEGLQEKKTLFLGAGAGRYCLELHRRLRFSLSILTDINPLFLLILRRLLQGETMDVWELPFAPREPEHHAVLHHLSSSLRLEEDLMLAFADSRALPFAERSLDLIVAPWFLDIQPEPPQIFLSKMNRLLVVGGKLHITGSLAFHFSRPELNLNAPELIAVAEKCGYTLQAQMTKEQDYLRSPFAAGYRVEQVHYMTFTKNAEVPPISPGELPRWLDQIDLPVPMEPYFAPFVQKHSVLAETAKQINGKLSIRSMARFLSRRFKMSESDAIESLQRLLLKLHEENTYQSQP
jgi:hypothetical protein